MDLRAIKFVADETLVFNNTLKNFTTTTPSTLHNIQTGSMVPQETGLGGLDSSAGTIFPIVMSFIMLIVLVCILGRWLYEKRGRVRLIYDAITVDLENHDPAAISTTPDAPFTTLSVQPLAIEVQNAPPEPSVSNLPPLHTLSVVHPLPSSYN